MKRICAIFLFIIFLIGCGNDVTNEFLIGGHWVGTADYENEKVEGDPYCDLFDEGMEFKDKDIVYVDAYERDFKYRLWEDDDGFVIEFNDSNRDLFSYHVTRISDDEMGFIGIGDIQEGESCYLERK